MYLSRACAGAVLLVRLVAGESSVLQVPFNSSRTVGPDGPWYVIDHKVDFPDQTLSFLPSLSETTVFVPGKACQAQDSQCPLPLPAMWTQSGAQQTLAGNNSDSFSAASWDNNSFPLGIQGTAHWMLDRFTTKNGNMIDGGGVALAENFTVSVGQMSYTLDVGLLSLYGGSNTTTWTNVKGKEIHPNLTLPNAYQKDAIPSISYGLHIGSVYPNISGSLYWGGYDSSRCLTDPIKSSNSTLSLAGLALNVSSGSSAYLGLAMDKKDASIPSPNMVVKPDPGLPYMYLPQETCDKMAEHLPIVYNKTLDLYLWETNSPAYGPLMTSPHYLSFAFSSDGSSGSIAVPITLLNLTLSTPLARTPTPYFPCKRYDPPAAQPYYILGRAFLQAAFLAHNWQTGKMFIAQAPGPDAPPAAVKMINIDDENLVPMPAAPEWQDTWSSLKALSGSPTGSGPGSAPGNGGSGSSSGSGSGSTSSGDSGLSAGAAAGIGVGVGLAALALLAGGFIYWRRKRRATSPPAHVAELPEDNARMEVGDGAGARYAYYDDRDKDKPVRPPTELMATEQPAELYGSHAPARPGDSPHTK